MLTHYTKSIESVVSILRYGFLWVASRRKLIRALVPGGGFESHEPHQHGIVSFTELAPPSTEKHRRLFGKFGIVVSEQWMKRWNAAPVLYLDDNGPVFSAFARIFRLGHRDLLDRIGDSTDQFRLKARVLAGLAGFHGAKLWGELCILHAHMEHARYADQREWRIVNPIPIQDISARSTEAVARTIPPQGWQLVDGLYRVVVKQQDIQCLICPSGWEHQLREGLPDGFEAVEIILY